MMKTILFLAVVTCAMACVLVSCGGGSDSAEPEPPKPDSPSITIASGGDATPVINVEGGTADVSFTATAAWTASVQNGSAWLSVSPQSGRAGDGTVHITAKANETYDERNAAVLLTCGTASKTVTVTQKQKDALTLTSGKVELEAEGGTFSIRLKTNVSVTCEVEAAAQEWLKTATGTRALTDKTLDFEALPNDGKELRQAVITLKGGSLQESVTVYQAGSKPTLVLTEKEYIVGSEGAGIKVELKSNTSYEVQLPEVDWIKETATRAISSYTHHFTVSPNGTYDSRTAEILFINREEGIEEKVTVTQLQEDAIIVAKNEYEMPAAGGALDFALQANVEPEVSVSADWMVLCPSTRGLSEYKLCFDILPNEDTEKGREGAIMVKGKESEAVQTITVKQAEKKFFAIEGDKEYIVGSEGAGIKVELKSNTSYEVQLPEVDWIKETATRAISSYTHHFTVSPNGTYDSRTAEILFINREEGIEEKVTVTQLQEDAIVTAQKEYTVEAVGGKLDFEVGANVDFAVETSADWIRQVTATRGLTVRNLSFEVAENSADEQREAAITLKAGELKQVITVYQKGAMKPYIQISQNLFNVPCEGGNISFTIDSNVEVELFPADDWCNWKEYDGGKKYTFKIMTNKTSSERETRILVENKQSGVSETIRIVQEAFTPQLEILTQEIVAGAEYAEVDLGSNVKATIDYIMTAEEADWINLVENRGMYININETGVERQVKITVTNEEYGISRSFVVKQEKYRFLSLPDGAITMPSSGSTYRIQIHTDQEVKAVISTSSSDWITAQVTNGNMELSCKQNTLDKERSVWIELEIGKFIREAIELIQAKASAPGGNIDDIIQEEW
ncbi:BACON domain-containing protein [Bacteroides rodentium]